MSHIDGAIRILNLYAGIGGNRYLWNEVPGILVTAVEHNPKIAAIYEKRFPDDKIITCDGLCPSNSIRKDCPGNAHQFLLEHMEEYDFIWASPPCQSHSNVNNFLNAQGIKRYPDVKLWQEIIYLKQFCKTNFVIENVKPYREFIKPDFILDRHFFWSNIRINSEDWTASKISVINAKKGSRISQKQQVEALERKLGFKMPTNTGLKHPVQLMSNCVDPKIGLRVLKATIQPEPMLEDWFESEELIA